MTKLALGAHPFLLGFEQLERLVERTAKTGNDGYPPYNIEQTSERSYRITLAVAGFAEDDLAITVENSTLVVRGRLTEDMGERVFLHRGIAGRQFQRSFVLAEGVEVGLAELQYFGRCKTHTIAFNFQTTHCPPKPGERGYSREATINLRHLQHGPGRVLVELCLRLRIQVAHQPGFDAVQPIGVLVFRCSISGHGLQQTGWQACKRLALGVGRQALQRHFGYKNVGNEHPQRRITWFGHGFIHTTMRAL